MKSKFPGFYHPDNAFFDNLFEKALIVLDTNILLDLYRLTPNTSKELIEIIKKLGDRIWIPYQVANEYHKDLFTVIEGQINKYQESATAIDSIRNKFLEKRNHPFLPDDLHSRASSIFDELLQFFEKQKQELEQIVMSDSVKDELCKLLDSKVGNGFTIEDVDKIYKEGEERFKAQIPPGFMDRNKPGNEKYGDLVVWKEILEKSKAESRPVLFVTDDTKDDWFIRFRGKMYGPHPLLISEFKEYTKQDIYIYTLDRLLENSEKLEIKVTDKALDEIKARKDVSAPEIAIGHVNAYDGENQSESINEPEMADTLDKQLMGHLAKRIMSRKGQIKITRVSDSEDDVDSCFNENESESGT